MSAPQVPGAPTGATGEAPPVTPPAAAPPPIPAGLGTVPQPADENAPWFKERLERAKQSEREALLAELGVKDAKKAKADLEAAEKAREEAKTVADKLTDAASKLTRTETEAERLRGITKEWAARQMMGLTPEQQAAVKVIAGDDAAEQLKAITALTPTWAKATGAAATPPLPTPATGTAPPPNAPAGTQSTSQPNHKEVHAALLKTNPFAAADYALAHLGDVFPEQRTT
jgi:hypothetical protein